jgi:hypothetical protein
MNFFWRLLTPRSTKKFFWKEQLESYKKNETMIPEDEIDLVIDLFIGDKISPDKFTANLIHIITNGNDKLNAILDPGIQEMLKDQTPSIDSAYSAIQRRNGVPNWFYAAYPDVLLWLSQKEHELDGDDLIEGSFKLFGIDVGSIDKKELEKIFEKKLISNNNCIRFRYLNNLANNFKKENYKNKVETSI